MVQSILRRLKENCKKSLDLNSRVIPALFTMLFICDKIIYASWLTLSVPKGKSRIILVLYQGIRKNIYFFTSQRLHPKSVTKPVKASEDYIVIVSE